ncbi:MAG TPA: sulfatase-like hydrolase/transferase [Vicinamibacterales bacterium]|nr:sulfatase-like hydrolase/transferase [Vicinamibacterales bacterium]
MSAACAAEQPPTQPRSIVLVTIDTLRADAIGKGTPALERLRAESIDFTQAITVAPLTLPSHASLFTGLFPPAHGARDNHLFTLAEGIPTYTEMLKSAGHATGAFVGSIVLGKRYGLARGFGEYDDQVTGPERSGADTVARASAWLSRAREPFFVWLHLFEPHAPYTSGSYAGDVAEADRHTGQLLDAVRARGMWDRAVVSVTSDHGEALGDHGEATHGFFIYDSTLRIPWLLRAPGVTPTRYPHQVRIIDIMPTTMAVAGASRVNAGGVVTAVTAVDAVDVSAHVAGQTDPTLEAYAETLLPKHQFNWSGLRALRTAQFKYIDAPRPELYDLEKDPAERTSDVGAAAGRVTAGKLVLAAIDRRSRQATRGPAADNALSDAFLSLGYIGYAPPPSTGEAALADPKDKVGVYRLVMRAIEESERGDRARALATLADAAKQDPDVAQTHFLAASILGQEGRFREAAAALERTLALNPRYTAARFKLALARLRLRDHAAAERELDLVLKDEPDNVRAIHNLAAVAYSRGDLARAETLERRAVQIDASYVEAWNTLGAIHIVRREAAPALEALKRATALAPRNAQAFANLALAYRLAGDISAADAAAAQACTLDRRFCSGAAR